MSEKDIVIPAKESNIGKSIKAKMIPPRANKRIRGRR
jgi:hypothetical protein